jgi:GNAT superfamily N-acetyltransferase
MRSAEKLRVFDARLSAAVAHYAAGFGAHVVDRGFVAEAEGERIGAAWVRRQGDNRGYGSVDDETPELTIAVKHEWRGQGIGTALAAELIKVVARISLSSDSRNPEAVSAARLRAGFARRHLGRHAPSSLSAADSDPG